MCLYTLFETPEIEKVVPKHDKFVPKMPRLLRHTCRMPRNNPKLTYTLTWPSAAAQCKHTGRFLRYCADGRNFTCTATYMLCYTHVAYLPYRLT